MATVVTTRDCHPTAISNAKTSVVTNVGMIASPTATMNVATLGKMCATANVRISAITTATMYVTTIVLTNVTNGDAITCATPSVTMIVVMIATLFAATFVT